jgi:radical SAM superfamily enzyme YgiQ (UPF0313 family)
VTGIRVLFVVSNLRGSEPIGVLQLAALLRQRGHIVRLACGSATPLASLVRSFGPRLVGYSVCTGEHRRILRLNSALKRRHDFFALFGGPHPTFFPEMIHEPGVDAVCRGEGEGAVEELADCLSRGKPFFRIRNLWVRDGRTVSKNPVRPLIADLDALPFADRTLRYAADPPARDYPVKSFLVSRGCPFRCTYCFNEPFARLYQDKGPRVRTRSVENVIDEILRVRRESRLEMVQFRESLFPWREEWLEPFAERYRREVGLPFYCHVRTDLLTARRVALLRRAGCISVNLGIECGDEQYRREMLGRPIGNDQIVAACRLLSDHGIRILADNMVGLPGTGMETDLETLHLNQRCGVDYALAMIFQPYPRTELGRRAEEMGVFDGDLDRIEESYYLTSPLRHRSPRSRRHVENLQKLFALAVETPLLEPLVRRLVELPPNLVYLSMFRAWFAYCYLRRIVPHRPTGEELRGLLETFFAPPTPEANEALLTDAERQYGYGYE